MSDGKRSLQLWRLLTRVRGLRVERKRRALADAQQEVRAADQEAERCRAALREHEAQRGRLLLSCVHGERAGRLWRDALRWHDARKDAQVRALAGAMQRQRAAAAKVTHASTSLQREIAGQKDAQQRARKLNAALRDE
ncbi:hypothetical protein GCM10027093_49370 [Paraburkholderia jirisanensis]